MHGICERLGVKIPGATRRSPRLVPAVLAADVKYPLYGNALHVFALPDRQ